MMGSQEVQLTCAMLQLLLFWRVVDNERVIGGRVPESAGLGPVLAMTEMLAVTII
jgi:hypothetical protein